jgi:hypothetical protein
VRRSRFRQRLRPMFGLNVVCFAVVALAGLDARWLFLQQTCHR